MDSWDISTSTGSKLLYLMSIIGTCLATCVLTYDENGKPRYKKCQTGAGNQLSFQVWSLGHAEQLLFSGLCSKVSISNNVTCDMSHFACHMSHCACHMSYVKCLCWSLGHAEQLLFSCLYSKVTVYRWKCQCFFWTTASPYPVSLEFIELVLS